MILGNLRNGVIERRVCVERETIMSRRRRRHGSRFRLVRRRSREEKAADTSRAVTR